MTPTATLSNPKPSRPRSSRKASPWTPDLTERALKLLAEQRAMRADLVKIEARLAHSAAVLVELRAVVRQRAIARGAEVLRAVRATQIESDQASRRQGVDDVRRRLDVHARELDLANQAARAAWLEPES